MTTAKMETDAYRPEEDRHLIAGRYRTFGRIGHGRLGEIFAATDDRFEEIGVKRRLALQIIPESVVRNNKLFNQLNLGYSQLRANNHTNIVDIIHFGRDGKFGYLVMERLEGASLRQVLDGGETLSLDEVRPVIRGVGEAISFLHARDMIHGNLTTGNVFITDTFEVRLLDIVPADPAEALVRSFATSDPFGRCTVEDDIFGLACLTYEMLSGKHPFNNISPAEARSAGLKADRINSLPDREWEALQLAFAGKQTMSSVADFMREFGIQGTERIQPPMEKPARQKQTNETAAPGATVEPVESDLVIDNWPSNARRVHKRRHWLRAVFLGILLAVLGAWSYFGRPEEQIVNLLSYLVPASEPDQIVLSDRVAVVDQVADAAPDAIVQAIEQIPQVQTAEPESAAMIEVGLSAPDQPSYLPTPAATTDREVPVTEFVVSVSEGNGAARITMPHTEKSDTPMIWWTSENSATADKDYISISQQTVTDMSFDESRTLNIPLIDDGISEPLESFFVNFGRLNAQQGQIERIATVRVDIIDDDFP
jgi:serine/threonine protein kinase